MKTFLRNYTSDVPVSQTIYRIEQVLIRCGVSGITKEYGATAGEVIALRFQVPFPGMPDITVRLPVRVDQAQDALWKNYAGEDELSADGKTLRYTWGKKKKKRSDFRDQAERTAWRLAQDWLEVEMSRMNLKQGDVREVFLAYVWDGRQTLFERIGNNGFRALLPETTGA